MRDLTNVDDYFGNTIFTVVYRNELRALGEAGYVFEALQVVTYSRLKINKSLYQADNVCHGMIYAGASIASTAISITIIHHNSDPRSGCMSCAAARLGDHDRVYIDGRMVRYD